MTNENNGRKPKGLLEKSEEILKKERSSESEQITAKNDSKTVIDRKDNRKSGDKKFQEKNVESEKRKESRIRRKINSLFIKLLSILVVILFIMAGFYFGMKKFTEINYDNHHAMVEKQLSLCQEFVSAKYRYSDIIAVKKSMGFSKSYSIVKFSGILRAGLADISEVDFSLSKNGRAVTIKVPKAELLGNELVSQEVFDEKQSIFVPISTQEIFDEIEQARRETAENMLAEGFLDEARTYAIKIICQFLYAAGFEEVVVSPWPSF